MNRRIFGSVVAMLALSATIASAEDIAYTYGPDACGPAECFEGLYVGGNVGVLSHTARRNDTDGFLIDNSGWSTTDTNFSGGIQVGYDWQCRNAVLGLVADFSGCNLGSFLPSDPGNPPVDSFVQSEMNWFTTLRARAGLAVDETLVYVSAGPAVAGFDTVWQDGADTFADSDERWGWAGSMGAEFMWTCNVSVGLELYFLQFADEYTTFSNGADFTFGANDSAWGGRLLVNYRLGG